MVNSILIVLGAIILVIIFSHQFGKIRHRIIAFFLIFLLVFTYFSFSFVIKDRDIDLKSKEGIKEAGSLYFLWLGNAFKNVKVATGNLVKMDWKPDESNNSNSS